MKKHSVVLVSIFIFICMLIVAYILTCCIYFVLDYFEEKKKETTQVEIVQEKKQTEENIINIPFNAPPELSYKSKLEIYDIRKNAVRKSIFNIPDYTPSAEVFSMIEGNKPWNSMKQCLYKSTGISDVDGPSEEGRYISNPELLVAIEYGFYRGKCEDKISQEEDYSTPEKITYNKEKNEIEVIYGGLPTCTTPKYFDWYTFKGLNARDLGYKYAFVDTRNSTFDIKFVRDINAGNSIVEFQDFIHVGGSCKHEGGCNNASPTQQPLLFYYPCNTEEPATLEDQTIYIKLWKNKPLNGFSKPDITEKIVFKKLRKTY